MLATAGVVVVVLGLVYYFFTSSGAPSAPLSSTDTSSSVSQQLLVTLSSLQTIQLNGAIFTDPGFVSLTDFSVSIPQQPAGRADPFVPFTANGVGATDTPAITLPGR